MLTELLLSIMFPIFLLIVLSIIFFFYDETIETIGFRKREWGLLIVGSASTMFFNLPLFFYEGWFLAFNIGGFLIPFIISFYFIWENRFSFTKICIGIFLVSLVSFLVTKVTEGGVVSYFPFFLIPPLLSVMIALVFFTKSPRTCAFAYVLATLGVIIGADLAHLPQLFEMGPFKGSIGGAGVYDMVFIAPLFSFCLSFVFITKTKKSSRLNRAKRRFERDISAAGEIAGIRGSNLHIMKTLLGLNGDEINSMKQSSLLKKIYSSLETRFATLARRIGAFFIDCTVTFPISFMFLIIFRLSLQVFISVFLLVQVAYYIFLEFYYGSTVGKALFDIEVRCVDGNHADFMTIFTRNIIRLLECFFFLYILSVILILIMPKRQRLGDIIADSIVVKSHG